jgi:hypothetical protein
MSGDVVNIENVHIGNAFFGSDVIPGAIPEDIARLLREQLAAGADPAIMGENGDPVSPDAVFEPDDVPTPEQQEEIDQERAEHFLLEEAAINAVARVNYLRNVEHHVSKARKLEGFQTNHERLPRKRPAVNKKQAEELELARTSLERACAGCDFRDNCTMVDNLPEWINVHPYKDDRSGKRRPGSPRVKEVESRTDLLKAQEAGVENGKKQVHCDPAKRK